MSSFHFDPYGQALSKVERGHAQDIGDVRQMIERGTVDPARARTFFREIEQRLYRYPAVNPASFRVAVERVFRPFDELTAGIE